MPDQEQPGQVPGTAHAQALAQPPANETPGQEPEDIFDRDRALATISKLRGFEKQAKDQAKELEALRKQVKDAEDAQLSEQERLQKRVQELEPAAEKAERFEAALTKLLTEEKKAVPDHLTSLLDRLDPAEQLEWIAANRAQFAGAAALQGAGAQAQQRPRPLPQTPRAPAPPAPADLIAQAEQRLRSSGDYGRI